MPKPKRARAKKIVDPEFAKVRGKITAAGNIRTGLVGFKKSAPPEQIRRIMPHLLQSSVYRQLIWPEVKPKSLGRLTNPGLPSFGDALHEIEWLIQSLLPFAEEIGRFVRLKAAADLAVLKGEAESHRQILDDIESEFGISVWLLQARINFTAASKGLAKQAEYARSLMNDRTLSPLIAYAVSWLSFRSELNVSAKQFNDLVERRVQESHGFFTLLMVMLGVCPRLNDEGCGHALAYVDILSLVDRYTYGMGIIQAFVASNPQPGLLKHISEALEPLSKKLDDPQLRRLVIVCGGSAPNIDAPPLLEALDYYSAGEIPAAIEHARKLVSNNNSLDALQLFFRAEQLQGGPVDPLALPDGSLLGEIAGDLRHLISYSADAAEAASRLSKVAVTYSDSPWAATLALAIERQKEDERISGPSRQRVYQALRASHDNPLLAFNFEQLGTASHYLEAISNAKEGGSLTCRLARNILEMKLDDALDTIAPPHAAKLRAIYALRAGRPAEAISILKPIFEENTGFRRYEAGIRLAESLVRSGQLLECAEVCADLTLEAAYIGTLLPIQRLVEALILEETKVSRSELFLGKLPVVIVFDVYSRNVSSDHDPERADAFRDFLSANGVTRPSELAWSKHEFGMARLTYFLRYVCVPEVLDQSFTLTQTREVEDERATVLVQLYEILANAGETPPPELQEELQTIRTRQAIRDTNLQLDQSRIYVDVEGIRKTLSSDMRENWSRYRLLSLQNSAPSPEEELARAIEEAVGVKLSVLTLELPLTEKNKLFERMVAEIIRQFASSKIFGLNANLSTNIRHGYVLREIRKPFIDSNLVTNRTTEEGDYRTNDYWLERINDGDDDNKLIHHLNNLSFSVDREIEQLNNSILRIKNEQFPDGLFDFTMTHLTLDALQKRVQEKESFDEFIDYMFEFLWQLTDKLLSKVRDYLLTNSVTNLQNALTELASDLERDCGRLDCAPLQRAINLARPEVRAAVERVASWFTLSSSREYQDYPLRVAFQAGLATVETYYSGLKFSAEFEAPDSLLMAGWTLPHFTRLFSILAENAAVHSRIGSGDLAVSCVAERQDSELLLKVRTQLSPDHDMGALETRVASLNAEFGRDAASEYVQREGKSGYPKIWKILKHDLGRDHVLTVSIDDDRNFLVEILMNEEGITV